LENILRISKLEHGIPSLSSYNRDNPRISTGTAMSRFLTKKVVPPKHVTSAENSIRHNEYKILGSAREKINNIYGNKKVNSKCNIKCCTFYYIKDIRQCAGAIPAHGNRLEPIKFHGETVLIILSMTQMQRYKGIVFRNKSTKLCVADYAKKVQRVWKEVQMDWTAKYVGFFVSSPSLP